MFLNFPQSIHSCGAIIDTSNMSQGNVDEETIFQNKKYIFWILNSLNLFRSSRPEVFCEKGVLKNFSKSTGNHLSQRLWHRCFPVKFAKFLRAPFFIEHLWWLLLFCPLYLKKRFNNIWRFQKVITSLTKKSLILPII